MSGWYRLHRGWQSHAVFRDEQFSRRDAFVWLIENAQYEPKTVLHPTSQVELQRGQLGHSLRFMAAAWKWDDAKVRRFLASLRKAQIIDAAADAGQTVITIRNYERYQTRQPAPDAAPDAQTPQERRSGDAKKEEGKKERSEEGGYAFAGQTIRLTEGDLNRWKATFHHIPDLRAELASIDAWFDAQPEDARKGWFHRTQRMLNNAHQRAADGTGGSPAGGRTPGATNVDDSFLRRLERAQQNGAAVSGKQVGGTGEA